MPTVSHRLLDNVAEKYQKAHQIKILDFFNFCRILSDFEGQALRNFVYFNSRV